MRAPRRWSKKKLAAYRKLHRSPKARPRGQVLAVTCEENGNWLAPRSVSRVNAIVFTDGYVFDAFNGWRKRRLSTYELERIAEIVLEKTWARTLEQDARAPEPPKGANAVKTVLNGSAEILRAAQERLS